MIPTKWKDIITESAPLLALMMLIEIAGGSMLEHMNYIFYSIPALLALVPMINAIGGNAGSVIGSRMSSGLHLGTIRPELDDREVRENMYMTAGIGMGALLISATFLYILFPLIGIYPGIDMVIWIEITLIASMFALSAVIPSAVIATISAFRRGKSPDDFVIPVVSTVGDFAGILSIILAIKMVGL